MQFTIKDWLWSFALLAALAGSEYRFRCIDHKWSLVADRWEAVSDRQAALIEYWQSQANHDAGAE